MAERYDRKLLKAEDLKVPPPSPLCPWDDATVRQLAAKSHADGHRVLWFKCQMCTLEYQVRTWREGKGLETHFHFCPECGSKDASFCLKVDHEIGPIFSALHTPPADQPHSG